VLAFVADRLEAVKWKNWKLAFYDETRDWFSTPMKLTLPKLFNLTTDPKEEYPEETLRNTWAMVGCLKAIREFYDSLKKYPAIPEGTPDPYVPPGSAHA
jgi:arylsulfatase